MRDKPVLLYVVYKMYKKKIYKQKTFFGFVIEWVCRKNATKDSNILIVLKSKGYTYVPDVKER